jgi:hypothetical protein
MGRRLLSTISLCAALLVLALATFASAADWRVAQKSGRVYVQQGPVQLASLSEDAVLKNGAVVVTEKNGRALLVRGKQTMVVAPNSVVTLPAEGGTLTRILEHFGQVEYNVDHRQVRHFVVETPYLAAVVKGTRFQVRVYKGGASVSVLRGRVEVTNLKTGEMADVLAGQRAVVKAGEGLAINGIGTIQPITKGLARDAIVEPAPGLRADIGSGGVTASVSGGVSTGVGGISTGVGGVSAGVGDVSAGVGDVSAGVGGVSAGVRAGVGGVSANVGGGVSAGVGD